MASPDDPVRHLVADPRALHASGRSTRCGCGWSTSAGALGRRRYPAPIDLVFEVRDEFCPWNAGRWHVWGHPAGALLRPHRPRPRPGARHRGAVGGLPGRGLAGHAAGRRPGDRGQPRRGHPGLDGVRLAGHPVVPRRVLSSVACHRLRRVAQCQRPAGAPASPAGQVAAAGGPQQRRPWGRRHAGASREQPGERRRAASGAGRRPGQAARHRRRPGAAASSSGAADRRRSRTRRRAPSCASPARPASARVDRAGQRPRPPAPTLAAASRPGPTLGTAGPGRAALTSTGPATRSLGVPGQAASVMCVRAPPMHDGGHAAGTAAVAVAARCASSSLDRGRRRPAGRRRSAVARAVTGCSVRVGSPPAGRCRSRS